MKTALIDFTRRPDLRAGFPNLVRGTLSVGAAIFIIYLVFDGVADAYQLDRDGEIGIGQVQATTERTTRRRRGRISIRYELDVLTAHGMLSLSSDSRIAPGEEVRFIYSPSSKIARLAPEPLQPGDMVWANFRSFKTICLGIAILCCGYYAYNQYWLIYVVASGRYTVNGKRVGEHVAAR